MRPTRGWLAEIWQALYRGNETPGPSIPVHAHVHSTAADTAITLLAGRIGCHLHIDTLIFNNKQSGKAGFSVYDGTSSASNEIFSVRVPAINTAVFVPQGTLGFAMKSNSPLMYSCEDAGNVEVTVFGLLESDTPV